MVTVSNIGDEFKKRCYDPGRYDGVCMMSQNNAQKYCESIGQMLPSARDLAIITDQLRTEGDLKSGTPDLIRVKSTIDNSEDRFLFGIDNYDKQKNVFGEDPDKYWGLWSSSTHFEDDDNYTAMVFLPSHGGWFGTGFAKKGVFYSVRCIEKHESIKSDDSLSPYRSVFASKLLVGDMQESDLLNSKTMSTGKKEDLLGKVVSFNYIYFGFNKNAYKELLNKKSMPQQIVLDFTKKDETKMTTICADGLQASVVVKSEIKDGKITFEESKIRKTSMADGRFCEAFLVKGYSPTLYEFVNHKFLFNNRRWEVININ